MSCGKFAQVIINKCSLIYKPQNFQRARGKKIWRLSGPVLTHTHKPYYFQ